MSCSVGDARAELGELGRARAQRHDDLFERGVAGALAEAVDRDLDLAGAGLDRGQRVGRGEPQVVVAVDADRRLVADELDDALDERPELGRDGVADGVGDVDRRGAGLDDRLVDLEQVVEVGPRGVLGGELDLGVAAELLAPVADPADRLGERRLAVDPELVLEVDVAGRDEDVEVRPLGDLDRLDRPLRVAVLAAGERRDRDPAAGLLGDPADRLEVAGRGGREAGLDDVDLEAGQLARDVELLGGGQAGARRLLPVAQGGVEDADAARGDERSRGPGYRRAHRAAPGVVADAWDWPATTSTGSRNGIWARNREPTRSMRWSRSAARRRSNSLRPDSLSAIQLSGERPVLDLLEDLLIVARTCSSMIRGPLT